MSKVPNTGHATNVEHFLDLKSKVTGFGAKYKPNNATIGLANITAVYTSSSASIITVADKVKDNKAAIADRHRAFVPTKKLATRILRAVQSSEVEESVMDQTKSLVLKIRGQRLTPIPKTTPVPPVKPIKTISSSHQSFINIIEHFNGIVTLLKDEANYAPNEADLTIASITALAADLKALNDACYDADTDLTNAIIARNALLYSPKTGLCDIASLVKKYTSTVYGVSSKEYKEVVAIKFTKQKI